MKAIISISCVFAILTSVGKAELSSVFTRDFTITSPSSPYCPPCDCITTTTTTTTTTPPCVTTTTTTTTTTPPCETTTTPPCVTTTTPPCVTTTKPCNTPPVHPAKNCPDCVRNRCTPNACDLGAQVPFPGDCSKFCKCAHDGPKEFACPGGLHFNEGLQLCDWPTAAQCTVPGTYLGGCEGLAG